VRAAGGGMPHLRFKATICPAREHVAVDAREKSFVSDVVKRFPLLVDEKSFIAVPSEENLNDNRRSSFSA
jgi:hypothetical protein